MIRMAGNALIDGARPHPCGQEEKGKKKKREEKTIRFHSFLKIQRLMPQIKKC